MSAGLTDSDSMFSVRETPWHGLGAVLDQPPATVGEAIEASGLGWDVAKEPIAIDRGEMPDAGWWIPRCEEIPGYYATVRQAERGMFSTKDLQGALTERGVKLSAPGHLEQFICDDVAVTRRDTPPVDRATAHRRHARHARPLLVACCCSTLLLYAQPVARIAELRVHDLHIDQQSVTLQIGQSTLVLPDQLAVLPDQLARLARRLANTEHDPLLPRVPAGAGRARAPRRELRQRMQGSARSSRRCLLPAACSQLDDAPAQVGEQLATMLSTAATVARLRELLYTRAKIGRRKCSGISYRPFLGPSLRASSESASAFEVVAQS